MLRGAGGDGRHRVGAGTKPRGSAVRYPRRRHAVRPLLRAGY